MYLIGWLGYVIIVKGEILPWAQESQDTDSIVKEVTCKFSL